MHFSDEKEQELHGNKRLDGEEGLEGMREEGLLKGAIIISEESDGTEGDYGPDRGERAAETREDVTRIMILRTTMDLKGVKQSGKKHNPFQGGGTI